MAYADSIRTTDYTREELATLIDDNNTQGIINKQLGNAVTTGGTRPNFTATLTPAPTAYTQGMSFVIQIHSSLITNAGATLNVNGLGAKDLKVCTEGANVRDPHYAELSAYSAYLVTFSTDLDAFLIANPTFGNEVNFTPTWGVVGGGPVSLNTNYDTNYRWLTPRTLMVRTYCNLNLSTATSGLTFALPFAADNDDRFLTGSGFFSSLTSYTTYLSLPYLYTDLTTVRILPNIAGGTISADSSFNCIMNIIYDTA